MNIVYFILRHYYNEMGKRFNQINRQITGQTMNPFTHYTDDDSRNSCSRAKRSYCSRNHDGSNTSSMTMFHETISRYWVLFSISSKNTFAFMNHTACFHLKFPQKYPVLPNNCPISWFWDWWRFCSVLGGIKRRVFSWNVLQSLQGPLTSCKNHKNFDNLFFLYLNTQLCLKVVMGRFRFPITPILGKRIAIEKFPPNVNFSIPIPRARNDGRVNIAIYFHRCSGRIQE